MDEDYDEMLSWECPGCGFSSCETCDECHVCNGEED